MAGELKLRRNVTIGVEALGAHRLRSALAALGVLFGVAAVVCMLAIGRGAEQRVLAELRRMGARNLHVEARPASEGSAPSGGLVAEDGRAAAAALAEHAAQVVVERSMDATLWAGARRATTRLLGVPPAYAGVMDLEWIGGRFIAPLDFERGTAVCVLSEAVATHLFPAGRAVGARVRYGAHSLRVVGVVRDGSGGERPLSYMPLTTAWRILPRERDAREVQRLIVHLSPGSDAGQFAGVIDAALARRHHGVRDFEVVVPSDLIRKEQRTQRIFQIVMGSIAGISLLVGGIGIANILFASVVERTGEIGVRRAVGARRLDIETQFLSEAGAIGLVGGIAGIVVGVLGALLIGRAAQWPILISPASIGLATGTALVTGLAAGFVPAHRAARVDVAVALLHP